MIHIALPSGGQALVAANIHPGTIQALDQMVSAARSHLEATRPPCPLEQHRREQQERLERWIEGDDYHEPPE